MLLWPPVLTPLTPMATRAPESGRSGLGSQGLGGTGCLPRPHHQPVGPRQPQPRNQGGTGASFLWPLDVDVTRDPRWAQRVDPGVQ